MTVKQWIKVTPEGVEVSGETLTTTAAPTTTAAQATTAPTMTAARGAELLTGLYRRYLNDYPRFFKMDELSKLGFVAAELLLARCGEDTNAHRGVDGSDGLDRRAVILFGRSGSVTTDRKYLATIACEDDYYPSPSLFVYTLPNMVAGEIVLRHGYHGETAFYLLPQRDDRLMHQVIETAMNDGQTTSAICGWVDYANKAQYEAYLELIEQE